MGLLHSSGVAIRGIASAVPDNIRSIKDDALVFGSAEVSKISESTGVLQRFVVKENICTSDLCFAAAEKLFTESGWHKDSIDLLIFVSQTPDYILPATSCSLHGRLGLSKDCAAFDINLGCSGYVYGLWIASNMIANGGAKKALLLVGDTVTRIASQQDRSVALLFGDAGTATILEKDKSASEMSFIMGTDGGGQNNLIVPAGGFRTPHCVETSIRTKREGDNIRSDEDLYMNGPEIFTFTLKEVPSMVKALAPDLDEIDAVVMHQANKFMVEYLAKRMKIPTDKLIVSLGKYGNTSSASIPLALTDALSERLTNERMTLLLAGFGVGYSWAGVRLSIGPVIMPQLVFVPNTSSGSEGVA